MNQRRPGVLAAALLAAAQVLTIPAVAITDPVPGAKDSRIRSTPYDPQQVVRLTSTGLSPLQVIFEAGERPVTIAGPLVFTNEKDARDWFARSSGNVLILQPLRTLEPSVLFVRASAADGQERHYAFELRTREGSVADTADRDAYMTVRFTYRAAPSMETQADARARRDAAEDRAALVRLARAEAAGPRNYRYDKRGAAGCPLLAPLYVFDNGIRTTLVFPPHAVLPEVYLINQDGKESVSTAVNDTTPTGLQVVLPGVYRGLRLRRGGQVCALRNNAFDPIGVTPGGGSGTVSPEVERQVRQP